MGKFFLLWLMLLSKVKRTDNYLNEIMFFLIDSTFGTVLKPNRLLRTTEMFAAPRHRSNHRYAIKNTYSTYSHKYVLSLPCYLNTNHNSIKRHFILSLIHNKNLPFIWIITLDFENIKSMYARQCRLLQNLL